jgi:hypothetical protein
MRILWYNIAMKNETTSTKRTTETVTISSAEYERLKRENEQLEGRVRWLEEQLKGAGQEPFWLKARDSIRRSHRADGYAFR